MSFLRRVEGISGDEAKYLFQSPCCQVTETLSAWVIHQARHQGGYLRMQCGRTATDPLRPVHPNGRKGCGGWFKEDVTGLP